MKSHDVQDCYLVFITKDMVVRQDLYYFYKYLKNWLRTVYTQVYVS